MVCFQPYKHYHGEAIDEAVRTGDTRFSKTEFLAYLPRIRQQTFKKSTILSAFRKTGIIPLNPAVVVSPLTEKQTQERRALGIQCYEEDQADEPMDDEFNRPAIPEKKQEFKLLASRIEEDLEEVADIHPLLVKRIQAYIQGYNTQLALVEQFKSDLQHSKAAQAARTARVKPTARRLTEGGVVTLLNARTRIQTRAEKEAQKADKRAKKGKDRIPIDLPELQEQAGPSRSIE